MRSTVKFKLFYFIQICSRFIDIRPIDYKIDEITMPISYIGTTPRDFFFFFFLGNTYNDKEIVVIE